MNSNVKFSRLNLLAIWGIGVGVCLGGATAGAAQNIDDSFYRRLMRIQNEQASSLTNYQAEIRLSWTNDMRADFGDVRFGTAEGEAIPYWIERVETGTLAVVWVKLAELPAAGATNVYVYYGNATNATTGNGDEVFRFFDDFEDGVVSAEKWPSQAGVGTYLFETNGVLQVNQAAGANVHITSASFTTSDLPMIVESKAKTVTLPTNGWVPLGLWLSSTRWIAFLEHPASLLYPAANAYSANSTKPLSAYHRLGIAFVSSNACEMRAVFHDAPSQSITNKIAYTPWGDQGYAIRLVDRYEYSVARSMNGQVDAIWIREYAAMEPTWSIPYAVESWTNDNYATYGISGRVTNALGLGVVGATLDYGAADSVRTDANGYYYFQVNKGWSGTLTPSHGAATALTPSARSYENVTANQSNQDFAVVGTPNAYAQWLYARSFGVTHSNAGVLTNIQVLVTVDTATPVAAGQMRADGGDVRFEDVNGQTLDFWIESDSMNATNTRIWVETKLLPAGTATPIYMRFGNPAATSASDGDATFEFFDDFEGAAINTGKWAIADAAGMSVVDGQLQLTNNLDRVVSTRTFGAGVTLEAWVSEKAISVQGYMPAGFWGSTSDCFGLLRQQTHDYHRNNGAWTDLGTAPAAGAYRYSISTPYATQVTYRVQRLADGALVRSGAVANAVSNEPIALGRRYDNQYTGYADVINWDLVMVRQYAALEPTVATGADTTTRASYVISGRVTNPGGAGVAFAEIVFGDECSTFTDATGAYSFQVAPGWSGTLTPSHGAVTALTPSARSYENVTASLSNQDFAVVGSTNAYAHWLYARSFGVTHANIGALTNVQVLVTVDTAALVATGQMRADGGDIRFEDVNGQALDFWIENDSMNATNTRIWVETKLLPAGTTTPLYMRFGNPAATSASDGDATFEFFDDFEGAAIDTSKWAIADAAGMRVADGLLQTTNNLDRVVSTRTFGAGVTLEARVLEKMVSSQQGYMPVGFWVATNNCFGLLRHASLDYYRNNGTWTSLGTAMAANAYRYSISTPYATQVTYQVQRLVDGALMRSGAVANAVSNEPVALGRRYDNLYTGYANVINWDVVLVRQYAALEPTVTTWADTTTRASYAISGRVTNPGGAGEAFAEIVFGDGCSTFTDATGAYSFQVAPGWSGTLTATSHVAGATFAPASRTVGSVSAAVAGMNFALTPAPWLAYGYADRIRVTVANANATALTNYQVEVHLAWRAGMAADFSDLCAGDEQGNALPFWIERTTAGAEATLWVKLPRLPALKTSWFYVYYGNPQPDRTGNGDDVFRFFDDFEDGTIDTNKWPTRSLGSYIAETNGVLKMTGVNAATYYLRSAAYATSAVPLVLEARTWTLANTNGGWSPVGFWQSTANGLSWMDFGTTVTGHSFRIHGTWFVPNRGQDIAVPHRESVVVKSTTAYEMWSVYEQPNNESIVSNGTMAALSGNYYVQIGPRGDGTTATIPMDGSVDAIWMREYAPLEPAVGVEGASQALTNTFATKTFSGRIVNALSGAGADGVTVAVTSPDTILATTNGGWYSLRVAPGWSGTVSAVVAAGYVYPESVGVQANGQTNPLPTIFWTPPPRITAVSPATGVAQGGETVILTGENFMFSPRAPEVYFRGRLAGSVSRINATTLAVQTPDMETTIERAVDIQLVNADGQSCTLTNGYFIAFAPTTVQGLTPTNGPSTGGTLVEVAGTGFLFSSYGDGRDGDRILAGTVNLNTNVLSALRGHPDAVKYSVMALTATGALLNAAVPDGALAAGDEVLLINLQGTTGSVVNVGRHEFLRVAAVEQNQVRFDRPKEYYYGSGETDDADLGTNAASQRVMLQRVPNYRDLVVSTGAVLRPSAWDGTSGGVLCFRVDGRLDNRGSIHASGLGYRSGSGSSGEGLAGPNIPVLHGGGERGYVTSLHIGGGGGGGHLERGIGGFAKYYQGTQYSDGGGNAGSGGAAYENVDETRCYLGAAGGGGSSRTGGAGGGAVVISAREMINSGTLAAAGQAGAGSGSSESTGPGGGGAGGSVFLVGEQLAIGTNAVSCSPGAGGVGSYYGNCSGGTGGVGRLRITYGHALEGSVDSTAAQIQAASGSHIFFGDQPARFAGMTSAGVLVWTPAHPVGLVDVMIEDSNGLRVTLTNAFFYLPAIQGRVVNGRTGAGVDGVEIRGSGEGGSVTTSGGGYYALPVPYGQTVAVSAHVPEEWGTGAMTPTGRMYTVVTQNQEAQDFTWDPDDPVVHGRIWNADTEAGQDGVQATWTGTEGSVLSAVSSNGGQYALAVPYGSTGTVSFAYDTRYGAGTFTPATHAFTNLTRNASPETWWEPPYVPGIRYVSLTGEHEYPYTNTVMAARDIQTAINASAAGDLVLVLPGRYDVAKAVTLNRAVTVRSTGNATNTIVRRVAGNTGVAYLTATNAVLDGFTLEGGYMSVWAADLYGSAVGAGVHNGAVLQNCIVRNNNAGPGKAEAGIVYLSNGSRAINCVVYANTAQFHVPVAAFSVSGVRVDTGSRLINSVVANNQHVYGGYGAGVATLSGAGYVDNSIVWGNTQYGLYVYYHATLTVRASTFDIARSDGQLAADAACMSIAPLFVDAAARDYRLQPESLAMHTGVDAYNTLTNDILRNPRRVGPIDRGAYEYGEVLPRIIGRVTNEYTGVGWSGVTLAFEGLTNVTSEIGGWYGARVPLNWSGVVTPSFPTGFFLNPPNRSYASVTGEVNNQLFSWRPQHPSISGRIVHQTLGTGIDGIAVSFSNGGGSTVTTNGGYYAHVVTGRWSGAVAPAYAAGGSFEPASTTYTNVITNQSAKNFIWVPATRAVSGRITHAYTGAGVDGATVNFPGSVSVVSAGGGYYTANVYYNYSGRATPMLAGGTFADPASRTYANVVEPQAAQDYVWTPNDPVISGRITNGYTQVGQSGIVVTFSDGGGAATTGVDGAYARVLPWNWSGTATPAFEVGTFSAASRTYANVQLAQANQHYTWTPDARLISGRITHLDTGAGIGGIPVVGTPNLATATTDAGGAYSITSFWGWSGRLVPEAPLGGAFLAASRTVNDLRQDLPDQDFVWAPDRVVSGRVTHEDTGAGVEGVTLTFAPDGGTATTSADGQYSKTLPHGWSGTIGASFSSGSFAPASRAQAALAADRSGQDFTWLPPRTIAGRLLNEDTGAGLSGVGLYCGTTCVATSGSDGGYQFTVQQGWSATVAPGPIGGTWLPASRTYANVQLDQAGQDYVERPPRTVMGRITNTITGAGMSGVILTFSGGAGTATSGSDGSFMASIRQGWAGTITPAKNGFNYAPGSRSLPALTADQTGLDFAGTPTAVAIAGRITHAYTSEPIGQFGLVFSNGGGSGLTDANGAYSVNVPYGWSGTVSFSDANGTAAPVGRTYATLTEPRSGQDYVWTPAPRTISGAITNAETGDPVGYVALHVSSGLTAETAADGSYSFTAYHGWAGTWSPELDGQLAPASRSTTNLASNLAAQNFGWTPLRDLSGRLTDAATGEPVSGGTIGLSSGPSTNSDETGSFKLQVNKGWSGSLQAAMSGYVILPREYTFSNLQDGRNDLDFRRYAARQVSGRVTNGYTGAGVSGVVVSFENLGSVTTDVGGAYAYPVWHGWSGSLQASSSKGGYFNPVLRTLPAVTAAVSNQNFAWLPADPVLSGRVTNVVTGAGVSGVAVAFSGGAGATTSGVNGAYQMQVPRGWSGSWTASSAEGQVQEPVSYSRENVADNEDGFDFAWRPPDPAISGRITHQNTGEGLDGIQVQIGEQVVDTADGGYYRLTVPLSWSGTLTPEPLDPNGVFAPVSRTLQNLIVSAPNQNFQWCPAQTISGRITNYYSGDGVPNVEVTATGGIRDTTDEEGFYELEIPPKWKGVATPVYAQGTFTPTNRSYGVVSSSQTAQNYSWMPPPSSGTRYVSKDGGHQYPYTNWAMAATNLYSAVRVANPGETVWVSNGVHAVRTTIAVDKPIRIRSLNGAAETVLRREGDQPFRLLYLHHGNCVVNGFTIENGESLGNGGGVYIQEGYLHSCIVQSNQATGSGGGVYLNHAISARAANLLVVRNVGQAQGGIGGEGVVVNCTVAENTPSSMGATVVYNVIADGSIGATEVRYCLTPQLQAGLGNQAGAPQFVDAASGNYRMLPGSLGVDDGFNDYMVLPFDLDGGPRAMGSIDLGPYEQLPRQGLAVALSSEPAQLPAGDPFEYVYTVVNGGPGTARGVVVTSALPGGVTYLSDDAGGTYQAATGLWNVGDLEPMKYVRMVVQTRADLPGYWTNVAAVTASQSDPGEPGYDRAECVTRALSAVAITNVEVETTSRTAVVEWDSVVGVGYDIHSFDGAYGSTDPTWTRRSRLVASEDVKEFLDAEVLASGVDRRYYQVTFADRAPTVSNVWAIIRRDIAPAGFTMVSPPVRTDRRFDGEMGATLAETLQGHDGGIGSGADEVFALEADGSWRELYLDSQKVWREADGTASAYELPEGQGLWILRGAATAATVTFAGPVGNDGTQSVTLQAGFNLIGLSEGKDLPLAATLAAADPQGGASEETADQLMIQMADGSWRFLMYVTDWGAPFDGNWFDFSTYEIVPTNAVLEPGAAYYYLRRGEPTQIQF